MKPQDTVNTDRRGFFRRVAGVGIAGAAGALALTGASAREPARGEAPAAAASAGYRETDHIRRYYDAARF